MCLNSKPKALNLKPTLKPCSSVSALTCAHARTYAQPHAGEESYEKFKGEKDSIYNALLRKSKMVHRKLNSIPGVSCQVSNPCTLHPTPCTLHPTTYTLHPTLKPPNTKVKPMALKSKPDTPHPTPPNPQTRMRVCQEVEGAMYAFPKIELPAAAVEAAEEAGQVTERERETH